ncbi:hypothetical protein [Rouxiella badensis]|uniref:hypothetical protein n=1 Tax=Rouxiella badensis TaxID=1646377 RepID=UPI003C3399BC
MNREISADDARCQVMQAQAVLSLLLNTMSLKDGNLLDAVGAIMTLLDGVPEAMDSVFCELSTYEIIAARGKTA